MPRELTAIGKERRDRKEILELAAMFLPYAECAGEHMIHKGYVCPWCESNSPDRYCAKEKVGEA